MEYQPIDEKNLARHADEAVNAYLSRCNPGYVLIVDYKGFRPTEVHGRYSQDIVEEAKRRQEQRDDVQRVVVEDAAVFHARESAESVPMPWYHGDAHGWKRLNVLTDLPLIATFAEL